MEILIVMIQIVWEIYFVNNNFLHIFLYFHFLFSMLPTQLSFDTNEINNIYRNDTHNIELGLPSNQIVDIRLGNNKLFFGTSGGLGYLDLDGSYFFKSYVTDSLPYGSNPCVVTKQLDDSYIVVASGGQSIEIASESYPSGTGIGYSLNNGESWNYKNQPVDPIPDGNSKYQIMSWGGQDLNQLAVTTQINNITYDLAVIGDYIYSASWAGGIRRFKFQNIELGLPDDNLNPWESIPLPMDNQSILKCGFINTQEYELNPNDPTNGGSHNHKGFSVFSHNDSTIWVGTAGGINKGIIDQNTNCIDWEHFNSLDHGFSGNWIIGFNYQVDNNRIWAITWSTGGIERNALSYTDDGGITWNVPYQLEELNIKFYNIHTHNGIIYASSEQGLWKSTDGENWAVFPIVVGNDGQQILSPIVYSSIILNETNQELWVGTPDGIAKTENSGLNWTIYRDIGNEIYQDVNNLIESFYVYPNPTNSYARFAFENYTSNAKLDIFNFSMEEVISLKNPVLFENEIYNNTGEFFWDCKNSNGYKVANGVYFCRLKNDYTTKWTKLMVID